MPGIWDRYRDVLIDRDNIEDVEKAITRPTDEDLNLYERRTGFLLPLSYRQFALTFGEGDFQVRGDGWFSHFEMSLPEFACGDDKQQPHPLGPPPPSTVSSPLVERLLFFATNGSGVFWGWDPNHVTDSVDHEYAIYQAGGVGVVEGGIRANSFTSFILDFAFGGGLPPERLPSGTDPIDEDVLNEINPSDDGLNRRYAFWPEWWRSQGWGRTSPGE